MNARTIANPPLREKLSAPLQIFWYRNEPEQRGDEDQDHPPVIPSLPPMARAFVSRRTFAIGKQFPV